MVVETSVELEGNQTPTVCSISYIRVWAYIGTFSLSLYVRSRRFSAMDLTFQTKTSLVTP